jgi:hypothetical protein
MAQGRQGGGAWLVVEVDLRARRPSRFAVRAGSAVAEAPGSGASTAGAGPTPRAQGPTPRAPGPSPFPALPSPPAPTRSAPVRRYQDIYDRIAERAAMLELD